MKFPSKFITFKESTISKFSIFLSALTEHSLTVSELYKKMKSKVDGPIDFIEILDCLYALNKISLENEVISLC